MQYLTPTNIIGAFIVVNLWTFILFGLDKIRAEQGTWRVSEGTLLAWAFFGGSIGAYAGRALFRHKTRKQPFSSHLHQTAIFQVIALACGGGWMLVGWPPHPSPLTKSSPLRRYLYTMLGAKKFGKLGNRSMARLVTAIDGGLVLPERTASCRVENVSRAGCRLHLDATPRLGATVLVRVDRIEVLGTVAWVRSGRCGVVFERPLEVAALERLRWIADHESQHEKNILSSATAVWR